MLRLRDLVHATVGEAVASVDNTVHDVAQRIIDTAENMQLKHSREEQRAWAREVEAMREDVELEEREKEEETEAEGEERPVVRAEEKCKMQMLTEGEEDRQKRVADFVRVLSAPWTDMELLRRMSRKGVPEELRGAVWRCLLGYLPAKTSERSSRLAKKRQQYWRLVSGFFPCAKGEGERGMGGEERKGEGGVAGTMAATEKEMSEEEAALLHQVVVDVNRTRPTGYERLFEQSVLRASLTRVLYVYSVLHQRSGYWQGLNEVPAPFYVTFLASALDCRESDLETKSAEEVEGALRSGRLEADVYWCLCRLVDGLQTHGDYAVAKYGTIAHAPMLAQFRRIAMMVDGELLEDLERKDILLVMYAFRWMICLLIRELPLPMVIRLWDCYLAEGTGVTPFHIYVCVSFLELFSDEIKAKPGFEETLMFLQELPTKHWPQPYAQVVVHRAYEIQRMHRFYLRCTTRVLAFVLAQIVAVIVLRASSYLQQSLTEKAMSKSAVHTSDVLLDTD